MKSTPNLASMPSRQSDSAAATTRADWIAPVDTERSFADYLQAVWVGRWILVVVVLAALAGAVVYVARATKVYEAHSQLLVTPLPTAAGATGLGLVEQSSDPLRDVETAAGFVTTTTVGQRVRTNLGSRESVQQLLGGVKVTPIANSNTVDIATDESSPRRAQQLANAFVTATVADRTAALDSQLDLLIPRLRAQIQAVGPGNGPARGALGAQLAELETLRQGPDPTVRVEALAQLPTSPISPRKTLTLVASLFGGLVAGVGLVFLIQLLDPRLRREEELREQFRLPILARVPLTPRRQRRRNGGLRRRRGPVVPGTLTPEATDAFRSLRSVLSRPTQRTQRGRIVLVTGPTPLDGKSTTALNLAATLAASDESVMLIEGDVRRPSIGAALNIAVPEGVESVLFGQFRLENALVDKVLTTGSAQPHLRLLLANPSGSTSQPLSRSSLRGMLTAARNISDWVIIDAPPLIYAPDLLSASEMFDDVILVVRLGNTNVRNLNETAEMLSQHDIRPAGFVVIGTSGHPQYY